MPDDDPQLLTVAILRDIRDEVRKTNNRLDETNSRLDVTISRLDETNSRLDRFERRQTESEVRIATELVALSGLVREMRDMYRDDRALRAKVLDHEARIATLEQKVG